MAEDFGSMSVRPYQLVHIIAKIGAGRAADLGDARLNEILEAARRNPLTPLTLRCNVDSVYQYQNPGRDEDTPEGDLFNDKRDLDIVQKLGLVPGSTRPAIELFERVIAEIPTVQGICRYERATSETWPGCADPDCDHYEAGQAMGLDAVIPPRSPEEMAAVKKASVQAMCEAEKLRIRPHHLMCMTCFHAGKEGLGPIEIDNLYEAIDIMQKHPDVPVELIAGPCMICPPCKPYRPDINLCLGTRGMSLRDQKKDLDVLQTLGLKFGDTLPAREVLRLLYDKIHSTTQICGYKDGIERGWEWRVCGTPEGNEGYRKGREAGLGVL